MDNYMYATQGFDILTRTLAPYVAQQLGKTYGDEWWSRGVWNRLYDDQRLNIPQYGTWNECVDSLDAKLCLLIIDIQWNDVFKYDLGKGCRTWVKDLYEMRNSLAHRGSQDLDKRDTWRMLDTMGRLLGQIDPEAADEVNVLFGEFLSEGTENQQAQVTSTPKTPEISHIAAIPVLPSWREVMEPQMDVAMGTFKTAEFAADLAQVSRGQGSIEYRDCGEFFGRTFLTEGMKGLLTLALKRVTGSDGDPVIQLKTAFGGGKTHSMLALYHMFKHSLRASSIDILQPVLADAGISAIPEVHVAVIVGTSMTASSRWQSKMFPDIQVGTIWGEIGLQLAESTGNREIFEYVRAADENCSSPGSEALMRMFDACGSCLILLDELVAYARKLGSKKGTSGTLGNFLSFIQELTEAARASRRSLVVASIPESANEIGDESGQQALEQIEHMFGRMESIWKPVDASEGFEVVRRRLFRNCKNPEAREAICKAFSDQYVANPSDYPIEARELEYEKRMLACFPIHPEVFDRLYQDWTTLDNFQRTRGVLRLMALVIHQLWMANDASPMIMPGSFTLDKTSVRSELTNYLGDNWNAIVDAEVDGVNSVSYRQDAADPRYGSVSASRRVARAVFLGSAPDVRGQHVRGIDITRIRLGVVVPGEKVFLFNDALARLRTTSSYLNDDGAGRYWYDTRPTLRKLAEDRTQQVSDHEAVAEIFDRLRRVRKVEPFSGVVVCPGTSLDVPEDESLRLVVLSPSQPHRGSNDESAARKAVEEILATRGTAPRMNKNTIVFLAADGSRTESLLLNAKKYLAWMSIRDNREVLDLTATQVRETEQHIARAGQTLDIDIQETYCWLMAPRIDLATGSMQTIWEIEHVAGGESIATKAARKLLQTEAAITIWAPALLKRELDRVIWREDDSVSIKQLWEYLCQYCYLPRLASFGVLEDAVRRGLGSEEYFGLAGGYVDGRYVDLSLGKERPFIQKSDLLVKPAVAKAQLDAEARVKAEAEVAAAAAATGGATAGGTAEVSSGGDGQTTTPATPDAAVPPTTQQAKIRHFHMEAPVDTTRTVKNIQQLFEEIVSPLLQVDGAQVQVTLKVEASKPDGFATPTVRAVSENCKSLKIEDFGVD